jgi:CheY-like chemotaxis protein
MDGYEATTEILRVHPNTKIIALTGTINPDNLLTGNESGILFYLQKPFTESALFDAVINLFPDDSVEKNQIGFKENAPVDLEELKRMTCGDRDFFNEMLKIFIRSSENGLAAIRHNFEISDWNAIG